MMQLLTAIIWLLLTTTSLAQNIVATVKPLHSLVQNILGDTAQAQLLVDNNVSPHEYQLKPSDIKSINNADIVFFIDESFELFINRVLQSNGDEDKFISLAKHDGINLLEPRLRSDNHTHSHNHGAFDAHIWLDLDNAQTITEIIKNKLSELNSDNQSIYESNLLKTNEKLKQLDLKLTSQLNPLQESAFIVQHDAYQYFDQRYKLNYIRAVSLDASIPPSVKLPQNIASSIKNNNVKCIFSEPQYSDRLVKSIAANTNINTEALDPIGLNLIPGKQLYFDLLSALANNFTKCLTKTP